MNDENRNLEYKRQLSRDERFERSVVAFLNSREGGTIFVGIGDDGTVCCVANPYLSQRQIADRIRNNIRPATMGLFDIGVEEREGKPVLRIVVSSGPDRPYHLKKYGMTPQGCFVRVGSQTQQIPEAEIEALFARRARTSLRTVPAPNQNLRFEQLRIRYEEHGKSLNDRFKETLELLTPDGRYNLVAYLLADDNNVSIKVAKYAGDDKIELIENEEYGFCSILRACDRVLDKLMVENTTSARIGPKYRQERKRYDPIAVREAVINAFVHNDWIDLDTPVFELFSDRLEITSHGSLLPGMTREDLLSGCSRIRNRELMRVFRDVELVEQLGSGMRRMLDAYSPDIFRYTETFFHVVVRFPGTVAAESRAESRAESGAESGAESNFTAIERQILNRLDSFSATKQDLADWLGKNAPDGHLNRVIRQLLAAGFVERTIPDKPTSRFQKYRLTAKGRAALAVAENEVAVSLKPSGKARVSRVTWHIGGELCT